MRHRKWIKYRSDDFDIFWFPDLGTESPRSNWLFGFWEVLLADRKVLGQFIFRWNQSLISLVSNFSLRPQNQTNLSLQLSLKHQLTKQIRHEWHRSLGQYNNRHGPNAENFIFSGILVIKSETCFKTFCILIRSQTKVSDFGLSKKDKVTYHHKFWAPYNILPLQLYVRQGSTRFCPVSHVPLHVIVVDGSCFYCCVINVVSQLQKNTSMVTVWFLVMSADSMVTLVF